MHGSLLKDTHFVAKDPLKLNNTINTCLVSLECCFMLFCNCQHEMMSYNEHQKL